MITVASLVGGALAGILASTALANFHVRLAGMTFGPLDTLLAAAGLLIAGGGVYARLTLYRAVKQLRATQDAPQPEEESQPVRQPEQVEARTHPSLSIPNSGQRFETPIRSFDRDRKAAYRLGGKIHRIQLIPYVEPKKAGG